MSKRCRTESGVEKHNVARQCFFVVRPFSNYSPANCQMRVGRLLSLWNGPFLGNLSNFPLAYFGSISKSGTILNSHPKHHWRAPSSFPLSETSSSFTPGPNWWLEDDCFICLRESKSFNRTLRLKFCQATWWSEQVKPKIWPPKTSDFLMVMFIPVVESATKMFIGLVQKPWQNDGDSHFMDDILLPVIKLEICHP